ncbi:hypothetical protein BH739_17020 [Enterococcus casseliflavus]|nr:hypothetical protein BH739_17020 [Enterococcus casseliflavus]
MTYWKIIKILNNNVVFVADAQEQEYVAVGKGIGFRHKVNEYLSEDEIMKIFAQINKQSKRKLVKISEEIPFNRLELSVKLVEYAEKSLNRKLDDNLAISLADHLHYLIERYKEGVIFPGIANEEIKRFYQKEYKVGCEILQIINNQYNLKLGVEEEASNLAFHIINASNQREQMTLEIMYAVRDLVDIVTTENPIEFDLESEDYSRFIIHLKFFMRKILLNKEDKKARKNPMLKQFEQEFLEANSIIRTIEVFILTKYNYQMSDDDKLYLYIHIGRLLQNKKES